jgi:hypothetical protein
MRDSIRFFVGLSLLFLIAFYGCGAANSEAEMKAAQEAMESARSYDAQDLATADWDEAMQAWEEAQTAVQQGKSAKTHFLKAKSRFEKTAGIAKSRYDQILEEVSNMQQSISEKVQGVEAALDRGRVSSSVRKEITPIMAEVKAGSDSIDEFLKQGSVLKARDTARDVQKKVYNAQLVMAGKKPAFQP